MLELQHGLPHVITEAALAALLVFAKAEIQNLYSIRQSMGKGPPSAQGLNTSFDKPSGSHPDRDQPKGGNSKGNNDKKGGLNSGKKGKSGTRGGQTTVNKGKTGKWKIQEGRFRKEGRHCLVPRLR